MTVYEILTVVLAFALGMLATAGIYLGLLNWMGGFHSCGAAPAVT